MRHWDQDSDQNSVSKEVAFCGAMADDWEEIRRIVDYVVEINKEIAFCAAKAAHLEAIAFPFTNPWDQDSVRKEVASCDAMADKWEGLKRIADHVAEINKEITFCRAKAFQLEEITGAKAPQLEEFAFCGAKAAQLEDIKFPLTDPWNQDNISKEVAFYETLDEKWEELEWMAAQVAEINEELAFCETNAAQSEEIAFCQLEQLEFHSTDPSVLDSGEQSKLVLNSGEKCGILIKFGEALDQLVEEWKAAQTAEIKVPITTPAAEMKLRRMDTTVADSDEPEACKFGIQPHRSNEDSSALDSGERVDATVTEEREPETFPATPHLTDPLVRDSGEKVDVAENEDLSVLDSGEQLNDTCTQEQLNVACTKEIKLRSPWKPRNFQDDEHCHTAVNAIGTLPFATEEPTVARIFDQNLIRTSFANLCMASCLIHTFFFLPSFLVQRNMDLTAQRQHASLQSRHIATLRIPSNSTRRMRWVLIHHVFMQD
jgi:hypothetical protein